jgi:hypothetical protein
MASLYNDRYTIGITVEDKDLDSAPSNYSFIMKDSINSLLPTASINFRDLTGQFNEYLSFINGVKIEITYGDKDSTITCPYIVSRNSTPEQIKPDNAGGVIEIPLIHEYLYYQSKQSTAFKDEISNIIKNKVSKYNFNSINIDTTINKGIWYQPYLTDIDFMINNLVPFAYSSDSEDSPFYIFIDSNNDFYFKSYKKLYTDANPTETMTLVPNVSVDTLSKKTFSIFNSTQVPLLSIKDNLHRLLFNFDESDTYKKVQDYIYNYPQSLSEAKYIPVSWNMDNITYIGELLSYDIKEDNTKNNNLGLMNNSMRKVYGLDKVILIANLNTKLRSGKKIELNVPTGKDSKQTDTSQRYSGNYLIETTYQKWTGSLGRTILVASRESIKLSNNYSRSSILITRK